MADSEKGANKGKYNKLTQKQYERKMQAWADNIKKKTERMTKKQGKGWLGEPKDVLSADVTEVKIDKKEKK
jgi:hypothetical protein